VKLLEKLAATRPLTRELVQRYAAEHGWPLVEGSRVAFAYFGEADRVNLRHWVYGLQAEQPFERIKGTELWSRVVELPDQSRVEYKIEVVKNGQGEWILDPLNPNTARDPFGANSVCQGPGYERPEWTLPNDEARRGSFDMLQVPSKAFGDKREVPIYLPARFRATGRYPLLVVHDGSDYVDYAGLRVVLDNLIDRLEVPPLIVALSNPVKRLSEYADDKRHARYLSHELIPHLQSRFPAGRRPADRGLLGASFGAVAALAAAWRNQGFYGRLALQSGSFAFSDIGTHRRGPEFDPVARFVNAFRERPGKPADRLFLSCGIYESLIYENRSLLPVLQRAGVDVRYIEARDGHNWENWRDRLREGLSWLWPGPLWMTYE
jgi:enterochelin esterase family protein